MHNVEDPVGLEKNKGKCDIFQLKKCRLPNVGFHSRNVDNLLLSIEDVGFHNRSVGFQSGYLFNLEGDLLVCKVYKTW